MTKKERQQLFEKFGGCCAYCGCELLKGWHADHIKPIRRKFKYDRGKARLVHTGECRHPARETIENCHPACRSCNINKHSMTIEEFRGLLTGFIKSLNRDSTQYKVAKRYGLIQEIEKPVVFFFESFGNK